MTSESAAGRTYFALALVLAVVQGQVSVAKRITPMAKSSVVTATTVDVSAAAAMAAIAILLSLFILAFP